MVALVLVLLAGCGATDSAERRRLRGLEEQLDEIEGRQEDIGDQTGALELRVATLRADLRAIVHELRLADEDLEAAAEEYREAQAEADSASEDFAEASRNYRLASERYRAVVAVLAIAAQWDSMQGVCAGRMTTQQYRDELRSRGVDLDGVDVDHMWPHARGGVDHPWNYQTLPSSLNRSLGASIWEKFATAPIGVIQGFVTSAMARFGGC